MERNESAIRLYNRIVKLKEDNRRVSEKADRLTDRVFELEEAIRQALIELRDDGGDPDEASEATARSLFSTLYGKEG